MRVGDVGQERPVVSLAEGEVYDLAPVTDDIDGEFLSTDGIARVRQALAESRLPRVDIRGKRVGAPVARPSAVVCVGMNYAAHAAETGSPAPEEPIFFFKHPNTVVGPQDSLIRPRKSSKLDWEVELAVIIGRRADRLESAEAAARCIAGYAIANDASEREWQFDRPGGQWSKGKSFKASNPLGPWFVPVDELPPGPLQLRSWVNGELRQHSETDDMIFSVNELVCDLSQYLVLEPGDIVNTGTPAGVALSGSFPYLEDGDVFECEIEHLGRQRQVVEVDS
jgi:2-keto-4-pentenoate hydratase/2-oxohepta-3-ene-1,7-dioic acid hydratase in catechol pathway